MKIKTIYPIALMLAALTLLAACGADGGNDRGQRVVSFSVTQTQTRADATLVGSEGFTSGMQMGVFGYHLAAYPDFMFDQPVEYNGTEWNYSPLKYWPNDEQTVTFVGYYPYGDVTHNYEGGGGDYTGKPVYQYTVPQYSDEQKDFMLSDVATHTKQAVSDRVELHFRHMLSQVIVQVERQVGIFGSSMHYAVSNIQFTNLYAKGSWSYQDDGTISQQTDTSDGLKTFLSRGTSGAENVFLLLPQDFSANATQLSFHYRITDSEGGTLAEEDLTSTISNTSVKEWLPGHRYTYLYTIEPTGVILSVQVDLDWQRGYIKEHDI